METLGLWGREGAPASVVGVGSAGVNGAAKGPGAPGSGRPSFRDALASALEHIDRAQHEADDLARRLAAGEAVDLHDVTIAAERASLTLEIALAIQRKCLEAYQEISRMQV